MTSRLAAALGLTVALASPALAAAPQITGFSPFGLERGVASELTVSGSNLGGHPRLIAPFGFVPASPAPEGSSGSSWKLKLTIDPATALGVYPVRVLTDDGISNPLLFAVGQLPQVAEKEDNSTFESAQSIPAPVVVEGQAAGNDVDYFRFPGKKGQKVLVDAQCARIGSGVDPSIRLTTAGRTYVGSADDSPGLLTDARLIAVLPEDGDYVIELSDSRYQGGGRPIYRLVVGAVPAAEEVYPIGGRRGETVGFELRGGTLEDVKLTASHVVPMAGTALFQAKASCAATGTGGAAMDVESIVPLRVSEFAELREPDDAGAATVRAVPPVVFNGRIDPAGDEDRFGLVVTPGQKLRIEVEAAETGSALDGILQVLGAKGAVLATADDTTAAPVRRTPQNQGIVSPDPSLVFTVPSGVTELTLALRDLESRGGTGFPYRIMVEPVVSDFELVLNDSQISVPKGGSAAIGVTVTRRGYNGPITLGVANPPPGLTVHKGTIADGQALGVFTVFAAPDSSFGSVTLNVTGEGKGSDGPIVVRATKSVVFAQQATLPTSSILLSGLAAAPASGLPVRLVSPDGLIEVAHGFGVPVTIKATRDKDANGALSITALPLPPGLAVPSASIAEKASEGTVTVNTTTDLPIGPVTIALVAKGKVGGADQTLTIPALTLNVVRPASVELASATIDVKAGATAEVKGKVTRRAGFKEPVTVKLSGLPAGTKADSVTVAPDSSEFTVKLVAEEKASAATASGKLALAFQSNKKDYPAPPTAPLTVKVVAAK
jgi:hypothetical protein